MFQEPTGQELAGRTRYRRPQSPYERFLEEQEVPIHGGVGFRDVRELALGPWKRMGGQGAFIQPDGTTALMGMYLVEVPARGALKPERHLYEELYLVVEGHGATEIRKEGSAKTQAFEWQPGSLFSPPANVWHRLFNTTSEPALILAATTAPHLMNIFQSYRFIFENPFDFSERYDEEEEYFRPRDEIEPSPGSQRAMVRTNFIADVHRLYIPLDNQRGPGYRRLAPRMGGNTTWGGFLAEYPSGIYSKAHAHASGAVLVCLGGKGYTYTWPRHLGIRPWQDGKSQLVKRVDYVPGGMVSAAPGGGDWFHQHFGVGQEPLRVLAIIPTGLRPEEGVAGEEVISGNLDLQEGGRSIPYREEDPHIRLEYEAMLEQEGIEFRMPPSAYE